MTENLATQFVEDRRDPEHVYKMSLCFFLYMDMCPPNMIDITSNFSLHQESPVYVYALSFCTVFFEHFIL